MSGFRIGQRVRAARAILPSHEKHIGATGVVVGPTHQWEAYTVQPVRWDEGCLQAGAWAGKIGDEPVKCLDPIDEPNEFGRFMERVLKPVKLPKEVHA